MIELAQGPLQTLGTEPWRHQKDAVMRAGGLDYFALFMEQGTGKTRTLIDILRAKYKAKGLLRTLIVCPGIVVNNWVQEFSLFAEPEYKPVPVVGNWSERSWSFATCGARIFVTSYTTLLMEMPLKTIMKAGFEIVVLDESHKIKAMTAKTTRAALKVGQSAKYRYILSGTPVLNTVMDLYSQMLFLDHGKTLGSNLPRFKEDYFVDFNKNMPAHVYFPNWVMKPDSPKKVSLLISPISTRVLKEECLDLPPLVRQRVEVELTPQQNKVYKTLEKDMVAEIERAGIVSTDLEVTNILRLQQIVSGYVVNDDGKEIELSNRRGQVLQELLEAIEPDAKVIIWAVFRQNYKAITSVLSRLGIMYAQVVGGMSDQNKALAVESFIKNRNVRVLLGHPRSAGIGINLVEASYSIFFSRGYSLEDDLQAEARNYRAGSERHTKITRIDLVSPGTVDEVILQALACKQSLSDAVLNHYTKGKK